MPGNSFGEIFRITTFGESHGKSMGVVIDGCPAGIEIDMNFIQNELNKRKPGQSKITSQRKEEDKFELISGVYERVSLGSPICILIPNKDHRSKDYGSIKNIYRPSHADFTYDIKYGIRDYRGGGRSSARETVARVAAGAIAKLILKTFDIEIIAFVRSVGSLTAEIDITALNAEVVDQNIMRCPDQHSAEKMIELIENVAEKGDTIGGVVQCVVKGVPSGLGEPVFDKLQSVLAKGMMSINAVKGFEIGSGFKASSMFGSNHNDAFELKDEKIVTKTNNSGGVQGGISNGMDVFFNVAFKPVATIMQKQTTVDKSGKTTQIKPEGRHDPCVVPRAVPIVEAMTAISMVDFILRNRSSRI